MGGRNTHEIIKEYVPDPQLKQLLIDMQRQNAQLTTQFHDLCQRIQDQEIDSFEDLQKFDAKAADALVKLSLQVKPLQMEGQNFGFFGITSTGKSTLINKLIGEDVAEVGAGETTTKFQKYTGNGYSLYDVPGRNDDVTYFSMQYISFWKGLTGRIVVINATVKEMTKVFRLLDAINLTYDIVVNKFDNVSSEDREKFKEKIKGEVSQNGIKGVNRIWFVSAENPKQFPDWVNMVDYLTGTS